MSSSESDKKINDMLLSDLVPPLRQSNGFCRSLECRLTLRILKGDVDCYIVAVKLMRNATCADKGSTVALVHDEILGTS